MKRYIVGLNGATAQPEEHLPDGAFLARVQRLQYRWHKQKAYYVVLFSVIEPESLVGHRFTARLDCSARALWRLNWFLRDFGYDPDLLSRNEIDDRYLVGLCGVIQVRSRVVNGSSVLLLDGFAPRQQWGTISGEVEHRVHTRIDK